MSRYVNEKIPEILKTLWIPVTEQLPEVGRYLVCYHPCNDDRVDWTVKRVGIDSFKKGGWARAKYQRIIAWMPLPEEWDGDDVQTEQVSQSEDRA